MERRAAVLGHPIAHSLSPVLHRAAYRGLGLDWEYTAIDLTVPELPAFIAALDESWAGLSLTMPLKQDVIPLLDHVEPLADVVGAVNTVLVNAVAGAHRTLVGANTDVYGLVAALREVVPAEHSVATAAIVGAGATAASALAGLAQLGCSTPTVLARDIGRTARFRRAAHQMGVAPVFRPMERLDQTADAMCSVEVVVCALPAHAADALAAELVGRRPAGVLLDVAYDPRPTALSAAWARAGGAVVGGERMLLHQAAEQVRLMTGLPAPVPEMDAALEEALGAAAA